MSLLRHPSASRYWSMPLIFLVATTAASTAMAAPLFQLPAYARQITNGVFDLE